MAFGPFSLFTLLGSIGYAIHDEAKKNARNAKIDAEYFAMTRNGIKSKPTSCFNIIIRMTTVSGIFIRLVKRGRIWAIIAHKLSAGS